MSAFPTQVLAAGLTALLLYVTHKYIFFVQEIIDYYKRCSEACQLTLFTFHVSAVIAIRLALEDFHPYVSSPHRWAREPNALSEHDTQRAAAATHDLYSSHPPSNGEWRFDG